MSAPATSGPGIVVFGAGGKMGQRVTAAASDAGLKVHAGLERAGSPSLGVDVGVLAGVGALGVVVTSDVSAALSGSGAQGSSTRVAIDFTEAAASIANAELCAAAGVPVVVATTGHSAAQKARLAELSARVAIVFAPNMSVGMNLLFAVLPKIAATLGEEYDIEVVEAHHRLKKDAPSGTALKLGEVLAQGMGWAYDDVAKYERHGITGERPRREIGMQTVRAGDIVGDHTVYFGAVGERIEITHRASSRDTFARGSVRAARWLAGRGPGLYDMLDVLGLR